MAVATDGAIYSLDAAGRRLWEALHAGWSPDDLVMAAAHKGGIAANAAHAQITGTVQSWRELGLPGRPASSAP